MLNGYAARGDQQQGRDQEARIGSANLQHL